MDHMGETTSLWAFAAPLVSAMPPSEPRSPHGAVQGPGLLGSEAFTLCPFPALVEKTALDVIYPSYLPAVQTHPRALNQCLSRLHLVRTVSLFSSLSKE